SCKSPTRSLYISAESEREPRHCGPLISQTGDRTSQNPRRIVIRCLDVSNRNEPIGARAQDDRNSTMARAAANGTVRLAASAGPGQAVGMTLSPNPYRGFRFPPAVIEHAVWLYHCFSLSLRDVELLAARGIVVSYESIREWGLRFGQIFANMLRR